FQEINTRNTTLQNDSLISVKDGDYWGCLNIQSGELLIPILYDTIQYSRSSSQIEAIKDGETEVFDR
ncbi:MAG: hypothetical protein MK212_22340, partial [Saprospiraceae bacterium]|nr:hypothetical protein [Saprospiraceae bacterium]